MKNVISLENVLELFQQQRNFLYVAIHDPEQAASLVIQVRLFLTTDKPEDRARKRTLIRMLNFFNEIEDLKRRFLSALEKHDPKLLELLMAHGLKG